ncbi:hypothetical protein QP978_06795 [Corynebacterium sp. MSK035]|uniref:hypothetical protein n=1 Tax=Corynebacterium TaxID=1716 RepID=UPI001651E5DC|nr:MULTISPECIES: hypothetical protein [unclassified Corynebacterium]MBC6764887.1 hypothetical protein [Corynebacterium sp. LK22]MDK8810614.1 hypothetical protein [Corynebacterium sp. MSK035]MDK8850717.1 hypothetical protein [Corynebacterium sp. MSK019]
MTTHTPTPSTSSGGKTRKQLIAILVLLVLIILLLALFLFLQVSGDRGGDSAAAEGSVSSSSENGDAQVQAQAEKAVVVYKQVLANPAPLQTFVGEVSPGGAMKYALVHLDDGCVPELVLNYGTSAMSAEIDAIGVYGVDENGQEIQFQNSYHDGVTSVGGVRRALQRATGQPGMFSFSAERMGRDQEDLLVTRQGDELVETPANPGSGEFEQFNWIPADNLDVVEAIAAGNDCAPGSGSGSNGAGADGGNGGNGGPNPTAGRSASGSGSGSGSSSSSSTSGTNSITGTVKVFQTKADVLAYEQRQDPNPGSPDRGPYAILILDQPTEVTAQLSGQNGPETRTIEQAIVNPALHRDGERATITFSDDEYYWPSDPGVPFGIRLEDAPRG